MMESKLRRRSAQIMVKILNQMALIVVTEFIDKVIPVHFPLFPIEDVVILSTSQKIMLFFSRHNDLKIQKVPKIRPASKSKQVLCITLNVFILPTRKIGIRKLYIYQFIIAYNNPQNY